MEQENNIEGEVEIRYLRGKQGPAGKDGKDGKDGIDGSNGYGVDGAKGDKGDRGPKGDKGDTGPTGPRGPKGAQGVEGAAGKDGHGSPDSPDEVIAKINSAKKKIQPTAIEGFEDFKKTVADNHQSLRKNISMSGSNNLRIKAAGVPAGQIETLNFIGATVTPKGDGREVDVTITGGGGSTTFYIETPSGTIDGSNTSFTVAHTITTVISFAINGQFIHPTDYSTVGTTITFGNPLPVELAGTPFTIVYA